MIEVLEKVSQNTKNRFDLEASLYQRKDESEYPCFIKRLASQGQLEAFWLTFEHLSTEWVDRLAEEGSDWLSTLPNNRDVFIGKTSIAGMENRCSFCFKSKFPTATQRLDSLPLSIQKIVCTHGIEYVTVTGCALVESVGRVRLVYALPKSGAQQEGTILVTNRLDWSPRKIVELYLKAMV